jgi:hypothetical protein
MAFLYTVNNYPAQLEPRVPRLSHTMSVMEKLAEHTPRGGIRWRYDTVVFTGSQDRKWHIQNFKSLCRLMAPFSSDCIFSFCDYYKKTQKNMARFVPDYRIPRLEECVAVAEEMAAIAADSHIRFLSCSHDFLLSSGVVKARCIDPEALALVVDSDERKRALACARKAPSRPGCGCRASKDIGAYDTCGHGCVYCYANANPDRSLENLGRIDPRSPSLAPSTKADDGGKTHVKL